MAGPGALNLIKLSVGSESVEGLAEWQAGRVAERRAAGLDPRPRHVTRMWPRRDALVLDGGSMYWVIRGIVRARQKIETFEEVTGEDGIRRCAIVMSPEIILVDPRPRRAFQGWRYLPGPDAPRDLAVQEGAEAELPVDLAVALSDIGVVAR